MLKKTCILLILVALLWFQNVFSIWEESWDTPLIIPRTSWWANSLYNDINSDYWKNIITANANYVAPYSSAEQIALSEEKTTKINSYLNENFSQQFTSSETITYNSSTGTDYAWDLQYTNVVDSIVVHHTHSEYSDDITGLNQIHKYHSINRQWWDIWYNYIIGYDGDIYEWREWWDYIAAAHSKYNNFGTIWIAVLWNYTSDWINTEQYKSLETLIQYLTQKYWIDLSNDRYYHMNCAGTKCDTFPIETYLDSVLIWHRDATHTSCPWDRLYEQIQQIRDDNLTFTSWFQAIARWENTQEETDSSIPQIQKLLQALSKYSQDELDSISKLVDEKIQQEPDYDTRKKLKILKLAIKLSWDDK